jgi:hypothetical protein
LVSGDLGEGTDGELTTAAQFGQCSPFADDALAACLVLEFGADAAGFIVFASFNGERALSGSGTELLRRQNLGNLVFETEAPQARNCE